jgi:hypothetical protein
MKVNEIVKENFKVTKNDASGVTLTKPDGTTVIIPPEQLAALQSNPTDPHKFSINPEVLSLDNAHQQPQEPIGPKVGSDVEIASTDIQTAEAMGSKDLISKKGNKDIGGDPTDDFIDDVTDKEFERGARGKMRESAELEAMLTIAGLR